MSTPYPLSWGRIALSGVLAGVAGGISIDAFIYLTSLLPTHASILSLWQFIASTAFGKAAYTSSSYAWAGACMHFVVSIAWASGYAYVAQSKPAVSKQPLLSGLLFGLVVYVVMQFVLFSAQALKVPDALSVYLGVVAHTVFFGIPVAYVARMK